MLKTQEITYHDQDDTLLAHYAYEDSIAEKRPVILVVHDWSGRNKFACHQADLLAKLGYVGFAVDMYGNGRIGQSKEEKSALIQPFIQDRMKLKKRILAAYTAANKLTQSNQQIGAIGFCFGGLCVLDLARSGVDVKGVVSFHGLLHAPENNPHSIKSKILVLHGYDDPMVPPQQVIDFGNEMTAKKADWQLHMYSNTMHSFTNPEANDQAFGTVYNPLAATRSWHAMQAFFAETFS